MDDRELKRLIQENMDLEADELIERVNSDPSMKDVEVPPTLREKVFNQIREIEEENARNKLSEKDQELVRLGKKYKKSRRLNIYVIIAAAIICALSVSVSAMGGPEKVFEKVKRTLAGREQTRINTDDGERIDAVESVSEVEAYEKIEKDYGVYPVRLGYLPEEMKYIEMISMPDVQSSQLIYEDGDGGVIAHRMTFNYRTSSVGSDVEDEVIKEYEKDVNGVVIKVKQYALEGSGSKRWMAEFEHMDTQYWLMLMGLDEDEVNQIIENLYFPTK